MSKTVGYLKEHKGKTGEGYLGRIDMSAVAGEIALAPAGEKRSDRSPDFTVLVARSNGADGWRDFGLAWIKRPNGKAPYLSILLNDDSLAQDYSVAAFPPDEGDKERKWRIVWGRPRGGNVAATAAAARDDDEIPF